MGRSPGEGDRGRAVEIVYRKGNKTKRVLVASPDPEGLAAAIQKATTAAVGGAEQRTRIEAAPDAEDQQRAAEEDAAAVEDAGGEQRSRRG
jgi:hypothetical protein